MLILGKLDWIPECQSHTKCYVTAPHTLESEPFYQCWVNTHTQLLLHPKNSYSVLEVSVKPTSYPLREKILKCHCFTVNPTLPFMAVNKKLAYCQKSTTIRPWSTSHRFYLWLTVALCTVRAQLSIGSWGQIVQTKTIIAPWVLVCSQCSQHWRYSFKYWVSTLSLEPYS